MTATVHRRWLLVALLSLTAPAVRADDVVESIAAVVNGHAIFSSQLDEALDFQCLAERKPVERSSAARKAMLDRLIDQSFIEQQIRLSNPAPAERIDNALQELRRQSLPPQQNTDAAWKSLLQTCGLTDDEVREQVRYQLEALRFVNSRFRSGVHVSQAEVEQYYRDTFLPQIAVNGPAPALNTVSAQITEILVQQKINQALAAWLQAMREQSKVEVR